MNQQETGSFPTNFTPVKNNTGVFSHNQKLERGSRVESLVVSIQGINNTEIIPHLNTSMLSRPKKRNESFLPLYKALAKRFKEWVSSKLFSLMLSTPRGSWISFSRPCFESQGEGEYISQGIIEPPSKKAFGVHESRAEKYAVANRENGAGHRFRMDFLVLWVPHATSDNGRYFSRKWSRAIYFIVTCDFDGYCPLNVRGAHFRYKFNFCHSFIQNCHKPSIKY